MIFRFLTVMLLVFILNACAATQAARPVMSEKASPPLEQLKLPEIAQKSEIKPEEKKPEKPSAEKKSEEQYIMLNFENADLETVISTVGEMLKINYIIAPGISGKITVQSSNKIPVSELFSTFQTMLEFNGFTAVKDGSFYRIVPIDTAKQQPVPIESGKKTVISKDAGFLTQEIPLEYVKANDVANIIRNLMPRGTDIIVYEPSNMLLITAPPAGILKVIKLLESIDIPATERDSIKTFVYNVENGEAKKLAEIIKKIYADNKAAAGTPAVKSLPPSPTPTPVPVRRPGQRPVVPPVGATVNEALPGEIEGEIVIEAYEDINALLIKATPRGYISLLETIKKLDVQPKQVLIEVLIAEITLDDTTKLGIEWLLKGSVNADGESFGLIGGFTSGNLRYDSTQGLSVPFSSGSSSILAYPTGAFANIFDPQKFNLLISAAATNDKINVLASPHILALDNKEAKIEIADEVPVATSISQPQASTDYATSQVQFKSAGTILTVTPHINEKKQVSLKITQEVSELGAKVPIGNLEYQGFKTRKATTSAIVQDGHTLVIGGIITERAQKTRSGIPFLSRIPVLGYLFGTTTDSNVKKELILMVTPHVVANHEEADALTKDFQNKVKGITKKIEERKNKDNQ